MKADDRRAKFVTVAAYAEAGGGVITDLFRSESESYLTDPALTAAAENIASLKKDEMAAHAAELLTGTGWLPVLLRAA